MIVSTKGRYALRVMVHFALYGKDKYIPLKEIAEAEEISQKYQAQIVVVTLETADGNDIDALARNYYGDMNIGYGARRDGALLLIAMDVRKYSIFTNGAANDAIGSSGIRSISNTIEPYLSEGKYDTAFTAFADKCEYYLDGHRNGYPFNFGKNLLIALAAGIILGAIVAFTLKGQLKTVRRKNEANVYVKPGSMQITASNDLFLYRNISRIKKPSSNNSRSGSSGSSSSVGGGSF